MTIRDLEFVELATESGPMRTQVFRPQAPGRYPGLVLYSEIFQITAPIRRTAAFLAGHGYVVAVPEIWHEFEAPGCALGYDQAGADRGNALKLFKRLEHIDVDGRAVLTFLKSHPACTGRLGTLGICVGGHFSLRLAAKNPEVLAATCFYATDVHKGSLGAGLNDDTLTSTRGMAAEALLIWGRQDPHVPGWGRAKIYQALTELGVNFTWHEFNGQHAFLRDEGHRYDPALARMSFDLALELFHRRLGEGDQPVLAPGGPGEARH